MPIECYRFKTIRHNVKVSKELLEQWDDAVRDLQQKESNFKYARPDYYDIAYDEYKDALKKFKNLKAKIEKEKEMTSEPVTQESFFIKALNKIDYIVNFGRVSR